MLKPIRERFVKFCNRNNSVEPVNEIEMIEQRRDVNPEQEDARMVAVENT